MHAVFAQIAAVVEERVEAGDVVAPLGEYRRCDRPDVAMVTGEENPHRRKLSARTPRAGLRLIVVCRKSYSVGMIHIVTETSDRRRGRLRLQARDQERAPPSIHQTKSSPKGPPFDCLLASQPSPYPQKGLYPRAVEKSIPSAVEDSRTPGTVQVLAQDSCGRFLSTDAATMILVGDPIVPSGPSVRHGAL